MRKNALRAIPPAAAIAVLAAACGGSGSGHPATVIIHGSLTPSSGASSVFGAGVNATSYTACAGTSPTPGTQVTVKSPSGRVIGTGTLGTWSHAHASVAGTTIYTCDMPFTIRSVPREARYGYQVNGVSAPVFWQTGTHPALSITTTSG